MHQVIYYFPNQADSLVCERICKSLNISGKNVARNELNQSIAQLAGLPFGHVSIQQMFFPPCESLIVFCALQDRKLDFFLSEWGKHDPEHKTLKAVMTPLNSQWNVPSVITELKKEQKQFQK